MQRADFEQWKASEVARLLALVESERRYYQDIFALLPVALAIVDSGLGIVAVNREFRRRFGLQAADLSRVRLPDLLANPSLESSVESVVSGESSRTVLTAVTVPGAEPGTVRVTIQRFRAWAEGEGEELLVTLEPEEGGEAAAEAGRAILEELPGEGWRLTGAEMDGRAAQVHESDREAWREYYRSGLREGELGQVEYRVQTKQGVLGWRRDLARLGKDGRITGITVDITAERRQQGSEAERRKREALERLSGRLAHVTNNLLMIINGYSDEILAGFEAEDPRRADLQEILKASARLGGLTAELNRLVRPPRYAFERFTLRAWLEEFLPRLESALPGTLVEAGVQAKPVTLAAHRGVLEGLLLEAARIIRPYLPGRADLSLNAALLGGGRAVLWLSLPGVELPAEAQERFFEPFAGPKEGPDPPLGIAGWLRPWEDLGGTIGLEMLPAGVVSLTLTCPAIEEGEATQPAAPAGPLVLLVEDEESIRQLVERSLGREGYRVVTAGSAEAALALPEAAKCDLLVTDVSLAGMGGRGLAERMRAGRGALPVLFISGATNDEELDRQLREGRLPAGTVFLQKPFPVGSLLEAVGKLVGRR